MIESIPLPDRNGPFEQGFWEALDVGRLVHQHCATCGTWHFPPRWRCHCGGALVWKEVSGKARLWSWTQVHAPVLPAFAHHLPYVVGIAELKESSCLRMVGPLIIEDTDPVDRVTRDMLEIGMELQAVVRPIGEDIFWPSWKLVSQPSQGRLK